MPHMSTDNDTRVVPYTRRVTFYEVQLPNELQSDTIGTVPRPDTKRTHLDNEWVNECGGDGFREEQEQQRGDLYFGEGCWLARRLLTQQRTGLGHNLDLTLTLTV